MTTPDSRPPNNIRQWRKALGMTRPELAAALGVALSTISFWELGKCQPSTRDMIVRLAEALGVEPEALGLPLDSSPLRRLRRLRGLTLSGLAKMVGVSGQQVLRWERGETHPYDNDMIVRLAAALRVDPKELGLRSYYGGARKTPPEDGGVQS